MPQPRCHLREVKQPGGDQPPPPPPRDGFVELERNEGADFVAARLAAYKVCASHVQEQVAAALGGLSDHVLSDISDFLIDGTKQVQRAWASDNSPPYVEMPSAFVHTSCHSADLPLALRQLQRHLRAACSPHVAVLNSKECGTLVTTMRSLVAQLIGSTARTAPGCSFDFGVLAGWHADLVAGRVAARARSGPATEVGGTTGTLPPPKQSKITETPLIVILEDAEHFSADVLNDLIYSCATLRSYDAGAPLPLCFVFALPAGTAGLQRLLYRSSIVLMHGGRFALAATDGSVDAIIGRLLCSPTVPQLSADAYAYLLHSLAEHHGSTTAFVRQLHWLLLHHFRTSKLSFLIPLEPIIPTHRPAAAGRAADADLQDLALLLNPVQLRALHSLPSVGAALADAVGERAQERAMRERLPSWLRGLARARKRRSRGARLRSTDARALLSGRQSHQHRHAPPVRSGARGTRAALDGGADGPRQTARERQRRPLCRAAPLPPHALRRPAAARHPCD